MEAALQEDVQAIGISILSGAHNYLLSRVMELLKEKGMEDVLVFVGGIVPDQDIPHLRKLGVSQVFQPGSQLDAVVDFLRQKLTSD